MAFERFTQTGRSFAPKASISTYGIISFNDGARTRFNMDEYKHCILYYDREIHLVGVELTINENEAGLRTLRHRKTGADISAKPFIDFYNIHVAGTTYYDLYRDEKTEYLVFDLSKGTLRKKSVVTREL